VRVLLTGITGFAGGHLAQHLTTQGDEIFGVARRSGEALPHLNQVTEFIQADLKNPAMVDTILARIKPEVIYHLAAQAFVPTAWANPWATFENNIRPQLNILQAILKHNLKTRLLVVTSDQVYGLISPNQLPVNEQTPFRSNNPYGVSKITQDALALQYYLSHQVDVIRIRSFNHIGPRQSPFFVTANFAKQVAEIEADLAPSTMFVGNLEAKRDFTDVRDMAKAYGLLARYGDAGDVYNVGTGQAYSIQYILDILLTLTPYKIEVKQDSTRMRPSDVPLTYADNQKLKEKTGWQPTYTLKKSLEDVLNYWRSKTQKAQDIN